VEKGTGALNLIEKGVVDDISYLYGVYNEKNRSRNKLLLNFIKRFSSDPVLLLVFPQLPGSVENECFHVLVNEQGYGKHYTFGLIEKASSPIMS
jgi:hypothetical protein